MSGEPAEGFMFGIGPQETFVILLLILLLFGADRIPEVARSIGRGMREFRKAANEFQRAIEEEPPRRAPGAASREKAPRPGLAAIEAPALPASGKAIAPPGAPAAPRQPPDPLSPPGPPASPAMRTPWPPPAPARLASPASSEGPEGPPSVVPPAGSA